MRMLERKRLDTFICLLVDYGTRPLRAVDLLRSTNTKANTSAAEECSGGTAVDACVEVEVGSVLVGASQTALGAEGVAIGYITSASCLSVYRIRRAYLGKGW